jgi:hypothetical protein
VRRLLVVVIGLGLALVLSACSDLRSGVRLAIDTGRQPPDACPDPDRLDVTISRSGEAAVFEDAAAAAGLEVIWPFGFAAWLIDGRAILFATDGSIVVREGDPAVPIGGVRGGPGEPFLVCSVRQRPYS